MASIHDILRPITLTKVISRLAAADEWLLQLFGMNAGGSNESYMGHGREGSYHIFNNTRDAAQGRAPGTAAGRAARRPVGRVPFVYPRMHEQISLLAEELHNLAKIDDPRRRDEAGQAYIRMQMKPAAQRAGNWRRQMLVGALRDSLYVIEDGDTWYFSTSSSGSLFRINFKLPAANQSLLNMTGGGDILEDFRNPSTNIPRILMAINAAFQENTGASLQHLLIGYKVWQDIINNDYVSSQAGIANPPFTVFNKVENSVDDVGFGASPKSVRFQARINSFPQLLIHVADTGMNWGAPGATTFQKDIPDDYAVFLTDVNNGDWHMYLGSEPIAEYDNGPETVKVGLNSWAKKSSNPTGTEVFHLDNAQVVMHNPSNYAYTQVSDI